MTHASAWEQLKTYVVREYHEAREAKRQHHGGAQSARAHHRADAMHDVYKEICRHEGDVGEARVMDVE